jgi:hypothetical protein
MVNFMEKIIACRASWESHMDHALSPGPSYGPDLIVTFLHLPKVQSSDSNAAVAYLLKLVLILAVRFQ